MNIKDIKERTKIGIENTEKARIIKARNDKIEQLKQERSMRRAFNKTLEWEYNNITTEIEKSADRGYASYTKSGWNDGELVKAIKKKFENIGFTVKEESSFVDADNGDPDSGEGRCDAHWHYTLTFSW